MVKLGTLLLAAGLLIGTGLPSSAQYRQGDRSNQQNNDRSYQRNNDRSNQRNNFYNGANEGVHGGSYYTPGRDRSNYRNDQGGIGPGKGALIGGAAGAALGALFGGGVQGTIITGAAGAGIGAVLGQSAQNNRDRNNYYRR